MFTAGSHRRGQGTIVGAAFLLLILMTAFTFYSLHVEVTNDYMSTIQEMQELDLKRDREDIEFISVSFTSQGSLNITVKNTGSHQVHLVWLGIFDGASNTQDYYKIDFYINEAEMVHDIGNDTIPTFEGEERVIQLVSELGNTFSYSYPEPSGEGDDAQASITITGVNTSARYNPLQWNLLGSTEVVGGSISDLSSNDADYAVFRSYSSGSGTDITDFVDNNLSNVDGSTDKGTHGDFSAQQAGPDSLSDVLTEENTLTASNTTLIDQQSFEGAWLPPGWSESPGNTRWEKESDQAHHGTYSADFDGQTVGRSGDLYSPDMDCSDATAIYIDFWYRDEDCESTEYLLQYYDGASWVTISDLSSTTSEYQWLNYQEKITNSQYFKSNFKIRWAAVDIEGDEHAYLDLVTVKKEAGNSNYELDLEVQWTDADYDEANEELAIYVNNLNTYSLDATGGYMLIGDGTPDWGSTRGTISFWMKWDSVADRPWGQDENMETRFSWTNLVLDWGYSSTITSSTSFVAGKWYFIAVVWNENTDELYLYVGNENNAPTVDSHLSGWTGTVSDEGVTENNFMASKGGVGPTDGHGDELRYWDTDRTLASIQSDYKSELTGSEANLRSSFKLNNNFDDVGPDNNDGSGSGSYSFSADVPSTEPLRVDAWDGSTWQNLFTDLTSGWNNVSVSSYLDSSTFTIRFKGGTETGDATQESWYIDAVLLHLWTSAAEYRAEVEFIGSSNLEDWTKLNWQIDSSWDTGEVTVTIQFYDYALGGFVTSGEGYSNYVSDAVVETDELESATMTSNPTHFRNATGHWMVKVRGVKAMSTPFLMKMDWIEFNPEHSISGEDIPYDVWQGYAIEGSTGDGVPIPYAYVSIYANGADVVFRNAITKESVSNPGWAYLDADGSYHLEIKSTHESEETFVLNIVVGSVIGQKIITQEGPV